MWPSFPKDQKIAVAHIDCDWYDPVKFCLAAVNSRLSKGSTLIFDDYYDYGGCRTAVDEFLADHGHLFTADMGENVALTRK